MGVTVAGWVMAFALASNTMGDQNTETRYRYVRERDIDLVLCVGASAVPAVAALFRPGSPSMPVTRHSIPDRDGEVDVVLEWPDAVVHVENKIDAEFQDAQPERYQRRAAGAEVSTTTALLAPQEYIDAHPAEAGVFSAVVSYEQLATAFESAGHSLAAELAVIVRRAIEQQRAGRPKNYDDATADFFAAFERRSVERGLPWQVTENDQSAGRGFYTLKQWDELVGRRVELGAKFNKHNKIDITVKDAAHVAEIASALFKGLGVFVRSSDSGALMIGRDTAVVYTDVRGKKRADLIDRVLDVAEAHIGWWHAAGRSALEAALAEG